MITAAKYLRYEKIGLTTFQAVMQLTDSVLGDYQSTFIVSGATTADVVVDLRRQIAARNASLTLQAALDAIPTNTAVAVTAAADPAPTAKQAFLNDVARLRRMKQAADPAFASLATTTTALATSLSATLTSNPTWAADL